MDRLSWSGSSGTAITVGREHIKAGWSPQGRRARFRTMPRPRFPPLSTVMQCGSDQRFGMPQAGGDGVEPIEYVISALVGTGSEDADAVAETTALLGTWKRARVNAARLILRSESDRSVVVAPGPPGSLLHPEPVDGASPERVDAGQGDGRKVGACLWRELFGCPQFINSGVK